MEDSKKVNEPTDEQWKEALRKYGWLRDEGDGERLYSHRPPLKMPEAEKFFHRRCSCVEARIDTGIGFCGNCGGLL